MVAYRYVVEDLVMDPPDPVLGEFPGEVFFPFSSFEATIEFTQPGLATGNWDPRFGGGLGDQGSAEIAVLVNDQFVFDTHGDYIFQYHLLPTDTGVEGSFIIVPPDGSSVVVSREPEGNTEWSIWFGFDLLGPDACRETTPPSPEHGRACHADGHWERVATQAPDIAEPGLASALALAALTLFLRRRRG